MADSTYLKNGRNNSYDSIELGMDFKYFGTVYTSTTLSLTSNSLVLGGNSEARIIALNSREFKTDSYGFVSYQVITNAADLANISQMIVSEYASTSSGFNFSAKNAFVATWAGVECLNFPSPPKSSIYFQIILATDDLCKY